MTVTDRPVHARRVAKSDNRGRITITTTPNQDFAIDALPDGTYLISPAIVETKFERWLRKNAPHVDEAMFGDTSDYLDYDDIRREERGE